MKHMILKIIISQIRKNQDLILNEARYIEGFMRLLMKQRNTGEKWSLRERMQLKAHIRRLVGYIPVLCIFLLPGGLLLIPLLAEIVDRRRQSRKAKKEAQGS
jgi:hypothetical protein